MHDIFKNSRLAIILLLFLLSSCSSYENFKQITEEIEIPSQIYRADYNKVWQETMHIICKTHECDSFSQESGVIKTRWKDNTLEVNFADSFTTNESVKSAQYKLIVNVSKGFRGSKEVTKVTIYKRQRVEQDFLQGLKTLRSDGIFEKTILYRLDKALLIQEKLQKIEDQKAKESEQNF